MQVKFGLQRQAAHSGPRGGSDASVSVAGTSRSAIIATTGSPGVQNREHGQGKRCMAGMDWTFSGPTLTPNGVDGGGRGGVNAATPASMAYQIPVSSAPVYTFSTIPTVPTSTHGQELIALNEGSRRGGPAVSSIHQVQSITESGKQQKGAGVQTAQTVLSSTSMQLPPSCPRDYWNPNGNNSSSTSPAPAAILAASTARAQNQSHEQHGNSASSSTNGLSRASVSAINTPSISSYKAQQPIAPQPSSVPASLSSSGLQHSVSKTWRNRLKNRTITTMGIKRSLSTPDVAAAAAADAMSDSQQSSDKRRNKLGYHRTSVACGHCRRRKIRCKPEEGDAQGRCAHCVRLKKDCNFYPVEATDRRPRSMSKPDIGSQEPASESNSPSPPAHHGNGSVSSTEPTHTYAASVPVTPTYDFLGSYEDFRSAGGKLPSSRSTNPSRKSSLAQMHAMPLTLKIDQGYSHLSHQDTFARQLWDANHHLEGTSQVSNHYQARALEDTSAAFWRLTSSAPQPTSFVAPHQNPDAMVSVSSLDSVEFQDDNVWPSQVPSRMGSIDQGMIPTSYALGSYPSDPDLTMTPGLVSASASTASLTASISDVSTYAGGGGEAGDNNAFGQFFPSQWGSSDPSGPHRPFGDPSSIKMETQFDSTDSHGLLFMGEDTHHQYPLSHRV